MLKQRLNSMKRRFRRDSTLSRDSLAVLDSLDAADSLTPRYRRFARPLVPARRSRRGSCGAAALIAASRFSAATFRISDDPVRPQFGGTRRCQLPARSGDRIVLILTGDAERALLDVTREGLSSFPESASPVANLTLSQLEDQLYARLGRVYRSPTRCWSHDAFRSTSPGCTTTRRRAGDVDQPGPIASRARHGAHCALRCRRSDAEWRHAADRIRRAGKLVDTLDLYDYLLHADGSHDRAAVGMGVRSRARRVCVSTASRPT